MGDRPPQGPPSPPGSSKMEGKSLGDPPTPTPPARVPPNGGEMDG